MPKPRTIRLDLQYEGCEFVGWQAQARQRTVQGVLEGAVRRVLDEPEACVVGAGRTDSGAHAVGQVAHVRTASRLGLRPLAAGLNSLLPRDVRVVRASEAAPEFHARFSATGMEYRYQIWHGVPVPPFLGRYCWAVHRRLDIAAMAEAARLLEGTQDLSSFRAAPCTQRSAERTVWGSRVAEHGEMVVYAIRARGFLQHMVRIVVGTLVEVGRGRLTPADVALLIEKRDRRAAPATAPARGLFLVRVHYEGDAAELEARADPVLAFLDLER